MHDNVLNRGQRMDAGVRVLATNCEYDQQFTEELLEECECYFGNKPIEQGLHLAAALLSLSLTNDTARSMLEAAIDRNEHS